MLVATPFMYNDPVAQPEAKLVKELKRVLIEHGARPIKIHGSEESLQEVGLPDLLVCHRGLFIGIEAKQPGGKLRPAQRVVLREIYEAGGIVAVIETVEQLQRLLSKVEDRSWRAGTPLCFNRGVLSRAFAL